MCQSNSIKRTEPERNNQLFILTRFLSFFTTLWLHAVYGFVCVRLVGDEENAKSIRNMRKKDNKLPHLISTLFRSSHSCFYSLYNTMRTNVCEQQK